MSRTRSKSIRIQDAKPGMRLGKPAMREDGTIMLDAGIELTVSLIERLKHWNIYVLDIQELVHDPGNASASFTAHYEPLVRNYKAFADTYRGVVDTVSHVFDDVRYFRKIPLAKFQEITKCSILDLIQQPNTLGFIHLIYNEQSPGYQHSLNVSVLSGVLGRWMGYTGEELEELIVAALLHDIGKTQLPPEIANHNGSLTTAEMEIMRTHPSLGYKLLSQLETFPLSILSAVLQHHERLDGSGYPLHLRENQIHPYAQLIAIADAYDSLTAANTYLPRLSPFEAVNVLRNEMFRQLNPEICSVFLNNLRAFLVGQFVLLSDGRMAEVVFVSPELSQLPIVRTSDGSFINLNDDRSLSIVDLPEPGNLSP